MQHDDKPNGPVSRLEGLTRADLEEARARARVRVTAARLTMAEARSLREESRRLIEKTWLLRQQRSAGRWGRLRCRSS